jgi:hypothetical protein
LTIELLPDPCASRTVKPRKATKACTRPIIAVDPGIAFPDGTIRTVVLTENGGYSSMEEYVRNLAYLDPHIIVSYSPEVWLYKLHEQWRDFPNWTWRVAVTDKHGRALQVKRVAYFGFRDPKKKNNRLHLVIDAGSFFRKHDKDANDLLKLGQDVRSFCNAHGLEMRASAAGIAGQLLKHPSFYPFARRRVPNFINEEVRPHLPGGYYDAYTDAGQRIDAAYYVDQECAHHYAAQTTPLPNANSVRAIGYSQTDGRYARKGGYLYEKELSKHGLIKARVKVPYLEPDVARFAPPVMKSEGEKVAYIWTNELPYLESLGLEVDYLIAIWGTEEVDKGLAKYATWAREVSKQHPSMKALLLMPYGLLARRRSIVTYHSPGGNAPLVLANQMLDDTRAHKVPTQPETANVLQLGLIQAFVRSLSLDMARQMTTNGHEVLSIYADGVFVKLTDGKSVPMFTPWRVKEVCQLDLQETLRVPVRKHVRRDYQAMTYVKEVV